MPSLLGDMTTLVGQRIVPSTMSLALTIMPIAQEAIPSPGPPVAISIPKQRWVNILVVTSPLGAKGGLAMSQPVQIECQFGSYGGKEVIVALEWIADPLGRGLSEDTKERRARKWLLEERRGQAHTPDIQRWPYQMRPANVQRPAMTLSGVFVLQGDSAASVERTLEGRGTIDVFLTDKKGKVISNKVSIPAAHGSAAATALEAELGPAKKDQPE